MSGGEYGYKYHAVNEFIDILQHYIAHEEDEEVKQLRIKFKIILEDVSKAMKNLEWFDSGDTSDLSEVVSLMHSFVRDKIHKY